MRSKKLTIEQELELLWEELDKLTEVVKQISDRVKVDIEHYIVKGVDIEEGARLRKKYLTNEGMRAYDGEKWV